MSQGSTPNTTTTPAAGFSDYSSPANSNFGGYQTPKGGSPTYVGGALPQTAAGVVGGNASLYPSAAGGQQLAGQYTPVIASAIGGPTGYNPAQTTAQGQAVAQNANQLQPYISSALTTGFDPQSQIFQQQSQLVQDQTRAAEAAAGVAGTPYGAGVEGQTMQNFDLNWLAQEQARQQAGAQTAEGLLGGYGAGATTGQNLAAAGPQTQSTLLSDALSSIMQGTAPTQQMIGDLMSYLTSQQGTQAQLSGQNEQGYGTNLGFLQGMQQGSTPKNASGLGQGIGGAASGLGSGLGAYAKMAPKGAVAA